MAEVGVSGGEFMGAFAGREIYTDRIKGANTCQRLAKFGRIRAGWELCPCDRREFLADGFGDCAGLQRRGRFCRCMESLRGLFLVRLR